MLFIAEIGMNYNGNLSLCYELIRQAKWAGADIAKFQVGWRDKPGELNPLTVDDLKKLKSWCDYFEIEFMASVLHEEAYSLLQHVSPNRYKIASRTVVDNPALVQQLIKDKRKLIVSLGMCEEKGTLPFGNLDTVDYLWCLSKYPTEPIDLLEFPKSFQNAPWSGYSDHSIGVDTCLLAVSRGATIIEKHFTLDKSSNVIRDHILSATPDEFEIMVKLGREIAKKVALGV